MGSTLRLVAGCCLLALAAGAAGAGAAPRQSDTAPALTRSHDPTPATVVPGELIVRLRSGQATAARSAVLRAEGVRSVDSLGVADLVHVELAPGTDLEEAAAELESRPGVVYAEPNRVSRISVLPNDPMLGAQWGLSQPSGRDIDAPSAWNQVTGSSSVIVAVIDTGVAYAHPDLNDNMWVNDDPPGGGDEDGNTFVDDLVGWDFVDDDAAPLDFNGHGTHVAGTIGAEGNNARGIAGVSWDVSIMALRAGDAYGGFTDSAVAAAIGYACANGADVVNGSFGSRDLSPPIRDAVAAAACQGTLFVFAAGNEGRSLDGNTTASNSYPCELHRPPANAPNVLCVGASGRSDGIASFSNRGPLAVHLAAPGVGIRSTRPVFSRLPGFPEGFESSSSFAGRWGARAGGAPAWGRSSVRRRSGRWSLADSPAGNYPNSRARSIRRDPFSLRNRTGCGIEYDLWLRSQRSRDAVVLDVGRSVRGLAPVAGFTGSSGRFVHLFDDLSAFDGAARVHLRLRFLSDRSVTFDGAYLDNVLVTCLKQTGAGYATLSGTSMAAPQVAGVAGLLLADDPAMTVAALKAAILGGVDPVPALAAHVASGGRLNAALALGLAPDDTGPDTTITGGPSGTTSARRATFGFTGSEPDVGFQCRHMNGSWAACASPRTYRNLATGLHTFRVRALDSNGNVDPTPATRTWRVR